MLIRSLLNFVSHRVKISARIIRRVGIPRERLPKCDDASNIRNAYPKKIIRICFSVYSREFFTVAVYYFVEIIFERSFFPISIHTHRYVKECDLVYVRRPVAEKRNPIMRLRRGAWIIQTPDNQRNRRTVKPGTNPQPMMYDSRVNHACIKCSIHCAQLPRPFGSPHCRAS